MNTSSSDTPAATPDSSTHIEQQFVDGPKLLQILFAGDKRPTLRWLRDQQKARRIPSVKIGRRVFFCPAQVRKTFQAQPSAQVVAG